MGIVYQARPSLTLQKCEGLTDVISIHELLTNQILVFIFDTKLTGGGLQIKQTVNS